MPDDLTKGNSVATTLGVPQPNPEPPIPPAPEEPVLPPIPQAVPEVPPEPVSLPPLPDIDKVEDLPVIKPGEEEIEEENVPSGPKKPSKTKTLLMIAIFFLVATASAFGYYLFQKGGLGIQKKAVEGGTYDCKLWSWVTFPPGWFNPQNKDNNTIYKISYVDSSGGGPNLAFRHIYWCDYAKIAASHPDDIACRDGDSAAYIKPKESDDIYSVGDNRQYTPDLDKLIVSSHQGGKCQVIQVDIDSCKDGKNSYVIYANDECPETPLPCPTSLNAVCNANGTATFSWTAVTGAVFYTLRANKDPYDVWNPVLAPSDGTDDFAAGPTTNTFTNPLARGVNWQWSIHPVKEGEVYSAWQPNVCYADILNCPIPTKPPQTTPTPYLKVYFKNSQGQAISHSVSKATWNCPSSSAGSYHTPLINTDSYTSDVDLSPLNSCRGARIAPIGPGTSSNLLYKGVTPVPSPGFSILNTMDISDEKGISRDGSYWFGWSNWNTGFREMTIILDPPSPTSTKVPTATPNPTAIPTTVLSVCSGLIIDNVTKGEENVSSINLTDTIKITINFTETTQVDAVAIRLLVLGQTIATMVDERNSTGQVEGTWGTNNWIYTGVLGQAIGSGEGQVDIYAFIKTNGVWK